MAELRFLVRENLLYRLCFSALAGRVVSMSMDEGTQAPKGRSPSFPGVALEPAIERARTAYARLRQHAAPIKGFTDIWGFKSAITGPASITIASLRKFGLLDYEGSGDTRTAKLTDLAVEILMKPDPISAIQQAALTPPIYREMWDKYHNDVPPEEALRYEFVVQRGFTENGFRDFLRIYRDTVLYAKLEARGPAPANHAPEAAEGSTDDQEEPGHFERDRVRDKQRPPKPGTQSYQIPVAPGVNVLVDGSFPLSPKEWTQFIAVLNAMRPALVNDADNESE